MKPTMKLQTLKGFRDFLPAEALKRQLVMDKFRRVFERYGFDPLETPALEYAEVLTGKYGEDADKLLYLFKDNGDREVGLRYDQTVPTARVSAQYPELPKPFKRYQMQPVWRAENTQKGRYREFLQCDADIIGNTYAPLADAELLALFMDLYQSLGLDQVKIVVNSRKILRKLINDSYSKTLEEKDFLSIVRSIDKLDKIGQEGVTEELASKNFSQDGISKMFGKITEWSTYDYNQIKELDQDLFLSIQMAIEDFGLPQNKVIFNPTLARGLDYYTGIIFEAVDERYKGSLGGGGRYDQLIGTFLGQEMPATGFALGFDRTLEIAEELGLLEDIQTKTQVLIAVMNENNAFSVALKLTGQLRQASIATEIYLDQNARLDKQLKYADQKGIPYAVIIGPEEAESGQVVLKDLKNRTQEKLSTEELLLRLRP